MTCLLWRNILLTCVIRDCS